MNSEFKRRRIEVAAAFGSRPQPAARAEPINWHPQTDDFGELNSRGYLVINPRFKLNPNREPDQNFWRRRVPARERT